MEYSPEHLSQSQNPSQNYQRRKRVLVPLLAGIMLVLGVGIFSVIQWMFHAPVSAVLKSLEEAPQIIDITGTPLQASWFVSGEVSYNNGAGNAALHFDVSGPKGSLEILSSLRKDLSGWQVSQGQAKTTDGRVISFP